MNSSRQPARFDAAITWKNGLVSSVFGAAIWLGMAGCGSANSSDAGSTQDDEQTDGQTDELDTTEIGEGESDDFIATADMPYHSPCDPFMQDCPDGEKCVPTVIGTGHFNALRCVPVLGDQGVGEACHYYGPEESTDDCDALSHCWFSQDEIGECLALCLGSADDPECPPASDCSITGDGSVNLCIPHCDPLAQDCAEGLGCFWTGYNFGCSLREQDKELGEPCDLIKSCEPGLLCVGQASMPECESAGCCSSYCDLELGDGPCAELLPGTVCAQVFWEDPPPQWASVGVCVLEP